MTATNLFSILILDDVFDYEFSSGFQSSAWHFGLQVRPHSQNTPLLGHVERETDDSFDSEQFLFH